MNNRKIKDLIEKESYLIHLLDSINNWVGSWTFFILHIIWFTAWILLRADIDVLTLILSMEAILLVILLLMAQNRQNAKDDIRDDADYEADLRAVRDSENILIHIKDIKAQLKKLNEKK